MPRCVLGYVSLDFSHFHDIILAQLNYVTEHVKLFRSLSQKMAGSQVDV